MWPGVRAPPLARRRPARLALVEPVADDHHARAAPEDLQVHAQAAVLDVPEVELDALGPRQRRAAVDLGPAGQAGAHGEPAALALGVLRDLRRQRRARPD